MPYNLLIVDDSLTTRKMIARTVEISGFEHRSLHEARDGAHALEVLGRHWIDLVLTDLNMPHMDGVELIDRLSRHPLLSQLPVVVITADRNDERLRALCARGVCAHLNKPFRPEELRRVLEDALSRDSVRLTEVTAARAAAAPSARRVDPGAFREAMKTAARVVLEEAAFLTTEVLDASGASPLQQGRDVVAASLEFTGAVQGCFRLVLPVDTCESLASDMAEVGAERIEVLGELLNMIAGVTLEQALAGRGSWKLDLPRVELHSGGVVPLGSEPDVRVQLLTEECDPVDFALVVGRS